ncbi:MAG: hypothetical protein HYT97_04490 [Elusimicrobia bacterium]|nr:hypothetical protein [Elusimicrobiota bacterium]
MKKIFFLLLIVVWFFHWFSGWVKTGGMDRAIAEHKNQRFTPRVLRVIAEVYNIFQEPERSSYYYRWIVDEYPDEKDIPRVRWNLGRNYEEIKSKHLAVEQYMVLIASYSKTQEGQLALNRYNQMRF